MPRNSSGTYTLPLSPVAPNTLIETTWANPTLDDIKTALTESLDRYGRGSMLAALKGVDGTSAAPMYSFSAEATTGMYRAGANLLGFSVAGLLALSMSATAITLVKPVTFSGVVGFADGTVLLPSIAFAADPDTGIWRITGNAYGFTCGGIESMRVSTSRITGAVPFAAQDGTDAAPGFTFASDLDCGAYHISTNIWGLTAGGTLGLQIATSSLTSLTPHRFSDGTVALPSITFASDTDLGFLRAASNIIGVTGNGTEAFRFDAANNQFYIGNFVGGTYGRFTQNTWNYVNPAAATIQVNPQPQDGTSTATVQLFRSTTTTGTAQFIINVGDNTTSSNHVLYGFNTSGLSAIISRIGRTLIGTNVDDGATTLQVAGKTAISYASGQGIELILGAGNALAPNTNYDDIVIRSASNGGITLSTGGAAVLGIMFQTTDSSTDGRFQYSQTARSLAAYAGNTLGWTLTSTAMTINTGTQLVASAGLNISGGTFLIGGDITKFTSANQTVTSATVTRTVAHGGPRVPDLFCWVLKCTTAEHGYAVNDEIQCVNDIGTLTRQYQQMANATNVVLQYVTSGGDPPAIRSTAGALVNVTPASWRWVAHAHWL